MSETYRTEHLKTLSNIIWILLKNTGVPASAMPEQDIYKALADLQEEIERDVQRIVRKEITNLLVETRFIDGKVDKLTDMVMDLQRKTEEDGAS